MRLEQEQYDAEDCGDNESAHDKGLQIEELGRMIAKLSGMKVK